jgi:hypothetical protein
MKAISKWNIGDLVTLSAAGKKIEANSDLWEMVGAERATCGFGMVVSFDERSHAGWPVEVKWISLKTIRTCRFKDYELKKYKADKNCP